MNFQTVGEQKLASPG